MKLADWARQQGITYKTAHKWFHKGLLPIPAQQLPSGTILVEETSSAADRQVALYARVSSGDQKADLDRQLGRLSTFAADQKLHVVKTAKEIGSGLNGKRPQLIRLLKNPDITAIVVEHRDRLARFGSEYIEAALQATGREVIVVDATELKADLVQDVVAVMTSLCARLYGRRAAKNRAEKAISVALEKP
jgi:putative resolvase